jgi:hypothetical protein
MIDSRFPQYPRYPYDDDDPFGSRPDEKPPRGWEEDFWEGVRERIEDRRLEPESHRVPPPPRRRADLVRLALFVAVLAGATAALMIDRPGREARSSSTEPAPTVVLVDGSAEPDVAVEWARSGGLDTGYVVLQSLDPDVSYVVLDRHEARYEDVAAR